MRYEQAQQEIIKLINNMTGKYGVHTIFRDFITLAACAISNSVDKAQWEHREYMHLKTADKYKREELDKFANMIALTATGLTSRMGDFLGEVYMQLEISNKQSGQFFSPFHVSELMAELVSAQEDEKGIITLNEPAAGSGGMIIAKAQAMWKKGVNYQAQLKVICNDIDHDVVKMCYIQLSLLGIDAIVMQGDTITLKMNEIWYTPMHYLNKMREIQDKERIEADEKLTKMHKQIKKVLALEKTHQAPEAEQHKVAAGQMDIFDFI